MRIMDSLEKVFWIRIGFAIAAGLVAGLLGFSSINGNGINGILIGFSFYIISYIVMRGLYIRKILPTDRNKLITTGLGSYIFMFLFVWILYNTIMFSK